MIINYLDWHERPVTTDLDHVENLKLELVEDRDVEAEHGLVEDQAAVVELEKDEESAGRELERDRDPAAEYLAEVEELETAEDQEAVAGPGTQLGAAARVEFVVEAAGFVGQLGSGKKVEHRPQESEEDGGEVLLVLKPPQDEPVDDHMLQWVPLPRELDQPQVVQRQTEAV